MRQMFIPEIGTKIVLEEDFYFTYNNEETVLTKGMRLHISRIVIKNGKSHTNHVVVAIPANLKINKSNIHCGKRLKISIYEFNEMFFEQLEFNEETKNAMIKTLEDVKILTNGSNTEYYKNVERIILNGKNLVNFSSNENPMVFFRKAVKRLDNDIDILNRRHKDSYKSVYNILNKHFRQNKISSLFDSEEDI